jgi:beta-glucosidase
VNPVRLDNAWDAIHSLVHHEPVYAAGYDPKTSALDDGLIDEAVCAADGAQVAVVFAGLPGIYESEGFDREHMELPQQQQNLITAVSRANPNTIVVLCNGAPVAMPWVDAPQAILEAYLPGQAGGGAIADVLFGHANPGGKLAETFPRTREDTASDANFPGHERQVLYREGLFVGYRYFDSASLPVLFPFGHGLSYTTFAYADARLAADDQSVSITITNIGSVAGSEVVQLYVHALASPVYKPEQELKAFQKVFLEPGEQCTLTLKLEAQDFAYYDIGHARWINPGGDFELRIGASSRDIRATVAVKQTPSATPSAAATAPQPVPGPMDDETFTALLNKPIPTPEPVRPFHLNSSLEEVGSTWLGARIKPRVMAIVLGDGSMHDGDETLDKMFEQMASTMPVRSLITFSGGSISHRQVDMLLALLNHQYLRAFRLWLSGRQRLSSSAVVD